MGIESEPRWGPALPEDREGSRYERKGNEMSDVTANGKSVPAEFENFNEL